MELFGIIGGVITGGFLYFLGMWSYLFLKDSTQQSDIGSKIGVLLGSSFFIFGFMGLLMYISKTPIMLIVSLITLVILFFKYPWNKT
jgi:hypothetical protein